MTSSSCTDVIAWAAEVASHRIVFSHRRCSIYIQKHTRVGILISVRVLSHLAIRLMRCFSLSRVLIYLFFQPWYFSKFKCLMYLLWCFSHSLLLIAVRSKSRINNISPSHTLPLTIPPSIVECGNLARHVHNCTYVRRAISSKFTRIIIITFHVNALPRLKLVN